MAKTIGYIKWGIIDSNTDKIIEEYFSKDVAEISLRSMMNRRESTGLYVVQIIKTLEDKGTGFPGLPKGKKGSNGAPPDNEVSRESLEALAAHFNQGKGDGSVPMVTAIRGKSSTQRPPGWDEKDDGHHRSPVPAQ